jgi:hypothetical protein
VYQPIEAYRDLLPAAEDPAHDPAARLQPLDAYLIHLMLNLLPHRPTLVDLAADATWGTTTVLGLTHPRVRTVRIPEPGGGRDYRFFLERYRTEYEPAPTATPELLTALSGTSRGQVFLLPADYQATDSLIDHLQECLQTDPDGLIVVLGLKSVGHCGALQALLQACGDGSERRFWLLRELGDCLLSSQVGLIARRGNGVAEGVVKRLQQLYTTNFNFLNLVKKACLAAIQAADVDAAALKAHHTGWLAENREVVARLELALKEAREEIAKWKYALEQAQQARLEAEHKAQHELERANYEIGALREESQRAWHMHGQACAEMTAMRQALWEKDQLLASLRASLSYRLGQRAHRMRQWLMPDGSRRFRWYAKLRRR